MPNQYQKRNRHNKKQKQNRYKKKQNRKFSNKKKSRQQRNKSKGPKANSVRRNKNNVQYSNPIYLSDMLLHALHAGKSHAVISVKYEALQHPQISFPETKQSDTDTVHSLNELNEIQTTSRQSRWMKLSQYLAPIIWQFYSYQQMVYQYNFSGMIIIETRPNHKLEDIVPNCNSKQPMDINKDSIITVTYLKDAECIDFFLKCCGLSRKYREGALNAVGIASNHRNYIPVTLSVPADGYTPTFIIKKPDECQIMQVEAKDFGNNLMKSGLWTCHALNINLYDQHVFALDVFASSTMKDLENNKNGVMINIGDKLENRKK